MNVPDRYCLLCRSAWAHGAPELPELTEEGLCPRCVAGFAACVATVDRYLARRTAAPAAAVSVPGQLELGDQS